jgi:hypothetical protein
MNKTAIDIDNRDEVLCGSHILAPACNIDELLHTVIWHQNGTHLYKYGIDYLLYGFSSRNFSI